ncbi:MAG: two-component regulator propeller domain-containing protein [Flavobacteriales bacterium]
MRRWHAQCAAVFVCIWMGGLSAYGQDPVHRRYTVADGLPSNTVYCALQDREGYMWFGTDAGAVRFDGRVFSTYGVEDGLTDNNIIKLAQDSKGRIWFLTLNGKLCYLLNDSIHNGRTDPELARYESLNGWTSFVEDRHGMLWFGGVYDNVLRLDMEGDRDSLWVFPLRKTSVVLDDDQEIVIVLTGRIHALEGARWVATDSIRSPFIQTDVVRGFDGRSPPLTVTVDGIVALQDGRWLKFLEEDFENRHHIRCWVDANGDLWVTLGDGGIEFRKKTPSGFAPPRRLLADEFVNFEYVDDERGRWICTSRRGLVHCTNDEFQSVVYKGSATNGEEAMLLLQRTRARGVLAGSAEGGIYAFNGRSLARLPADATGRVLDFAEDRVGNIWIASDLRTLLLPHGASNFNEVALRWWGSPDSIIPSSGSKALEILPDGSVWVAYFGFWVIREEAGHFMRYRFPDSLNFTGRSLAPHVDMTGRLWYEANERLHCIESGHRKDFPQLEGLTGLRITDIKSLASGQLLIGTTGAGVLVLDTAARPIGGITMEDGLISNDIIRIRAFHDTLLIATKQGLQVVIGPLIGPASQRTMFTVKGLGTGEVNDAITDGDHLLLATSAGLCSVPFPGKDIATAPPRIHIAGLWLNGKEVDRNVRIELAQGRDQVLITFRVIAFTEADRLEYQYRLRSADDWTRTENPVLELASLSQGSYTIAMRARRPASGWSEPVLVRLVVKAPWWMKGSTWIFGFLVICLVLVQVTRRSLRRKCSRALAELRERQVVNEERTRIATDIHDDLGADLSRLLMYARQAEPDARDAEERPLTEGLDRAIDKMDEIIWALDPRRDTLQSTVQFIEQQAHELAEARGLKFRAKVQVPREPVHLTAKQRRELMLLAREAVRNILDHAEASTLWIEWTTETNAVQLLIRDDGKGFDPATADPSRHGLTNMRIRAGHLGGTLLIEREDPTGTRVHLWFPLPGIIRSDDVIDEDEMQLGP